MRLLHVTLLGIAVVFLFCNTTYSQPAAGSWPMFHYNAQNTGCSMSHTVECDGALSWVYVTGDNVVSSPAQFSNGMVYVGSDDDRLYAFSEVGDFGWSYRTGDNISSSPALSVAEEVYVGSNDSRLYAFHSVGSLKWSYLTGGILRSSLAIDSNGRLYIGSHDNNIYVLTSTGSLVWSYLQDNDGQASPAIGSDGRVYIGALDNILYVYTSAGALAWSYLTGDAMFSSPAIDSDGRVYIGALDNTLHVCTSAGAFAWSYLTGSYIYSSPAIGSNGRVYVGALDDTLYAYTSAGALAWSYLTGGDIYSSPAIGSDGRIYVGALDDALYAYTSAGVLAWSFLTGDDVYSSPAIGSGGRLYVGSNDNNVYALGTAEITFTLYGDVSPGKTTWVSIPFDCTGITTTQELGESISLAYDFAEDDVMYVLRLDGATQSTSTVIGTSLGNYEWDWAGNSVSIQPGDMCKVTIILASGSPLNFEWTITGCCSTVQFDLYDLSGSNDNDNWISLPCYAWNLTTTIDVGNSIVANIATPQNGDTLTVAVWDVTGQSEVTTIGTYNGVAWSWNPPGGYMVSVGAPFIARPYRSGGMPTITWP